MELNCKYACLPDFNSIFLHYLLMKTFKNKTSITLDVLLLVYSALKLFDFFLILQKVDKIELLRIEN